MTIKIVAGIMLSVFVNCKSSNLNSKRDTVEVVNSVYHSSELVDDIPDTINSVSIVKTNLVNSSITETLSYSPLIKYLLYKGCASVY